MINVWLLDFTFLPNVLISCYYLKLQFVTNVHQCLRTVLLVTLTANSGPMSTSKPMSANPVAMTLPPRSWPSCPTFATRIRGRRPSFATNCWTTDRNMFHSIITQTLGLVSSEPVTTLWPFPTSKTHKARWVPRACWCIFSKADDLVNFEPTV